MKTERKKEQDRIWWKRNREKARGYARKWWAANKPYFAKKMRERHRDHPESTRFHLLRRRSLKELGVPFIITKEEFKRWYLSTPKRCSYCDLVDLSLEKRLSRGQALIHFTIDRKFSDLPYTIENICFACWTCNRLKSDVFTFDEWLEIAQKYIKPKWMAKLGENGNTVKPTPS